jgi:hypothetical protein
MKGMFKILTVFYILFPLVVIPFMASKAGNWFYLFGLVCYYAGVILVAIKQKIIFMIPLFFCGWFWYTYGFGLHDYVFFLFMCMFAGALFYQLAQNAKYFSQSVLPENMEAQEYELKIEEMNAKLKLYKQTHPTEIITSEIIDGIRNEVFFK